MTRRRSKWVWAATALAAVLCAASGTTALAADGDVVVAAGAGGYVTALPAGAKAPPPTIYRTANAPGPMPTNDWWSSLAWRPYSERQYPHPLAVQAQADGLRVYVPGAITANKDAVFGFMPERSPDDLILGHSAADEFPDARVDGFSDWFVTARLGPREKGMSVSYGHGSPFVYATFDGGEARVSFGKPPTVWAGSEKTPTLGLSVGKKHYALFAPTGSTWDGVGTKVLTARSGGKSYFSLAVLPDASEQTLALFARFAHAHVTGTKVAWAYDPKASAVTTTYTFTTTAREGDAAAAVGTLFALYPHQWRNTRAPLTELGYDSVRGRMKLAAPAASFATTMTFHGVLPALPDAGGADRAKLAALVREAAAAGAAPSKDVKDTYWEGKELGKLASLAPLAEQVGDAGAAEAIHDGLKHRLERWLNPRDAAGGVRRAGVFYYDKAWGTLIGYPASYGSDAELNDHHFHYGYFFKAAAEVARVEPAWAADGRWGAMLKLLVRDVASTDRNDPLFPFLRNFDPYAGHSWASGHAIFGDGNNNESSSEAMNAWAGLILLGQATGDKSMRDLGVYLYTTELAGIQEYWFDVHGDNRPAAYTPSVVTMVWGGKGANGTWFTNKPGAVHGINFLPVHGGSLYLGLDQAYAEKNYKALVAENKGDAFKDWPDVSWMFRALTDAADAMRLYEAAGATYPGEGGNTRANTYHWIAQLGALGRVDADVTADHPLYAVFRKGDVRSYAAYNMTDGPLTVTFSDGFVLKVEKRGFGLGRK